MMPPKRMRKKTRNEISTELNRAPHSRRRKFAFAPLDKLNGAAICTSAVGTVCILILVSASQPATRDVTTWRPPVSAVRTLAYLSDEGGVIRLLAPGWTEVSE